MVEALGRAVWIINPDILAARIHTVEALGRNQANLEAVRRIEKWLQASVHAHQTVGVETVLSTPKYRKLVRAAKQKGFHVELVYVVLNSPELNVARVKLRVKKGGHDVPVRKILARRIRSFEQLPWFLAHCDSAQIFDNSGARPRLIGIKKGRIITLDSNIPLEVREAVERVRRYSSGA